MDILSESVPIQRYTSFIFPGDMCLVWVWAVHSSLFISCSVTLSLNASLILFIVKVTYSVWKLTRVYPILGIQNNLPDYIKKMRWVFFISHVWDVLKLFNLQLKYFFSLENVLSIVGLIILSPPSVPPPSSENLIFCISTLLHFSFRLLHFLP